MWHLRQGLAQRQGKGMVAVHQQTKDVQREEQETVQHTKAQPWDAAPFLDITFMSISSSLQGRTLLLKTEN